VPAAGSILCRLGSGLAAAEAALGAAGERTQTERPTGAFAGAAIRYCVHATASQLHYVPRTANLLMKQVIEKIENTRRRGRLMAGHLLMVQLGGRICR
jgi:hypothetical protein